MQNATLRQQKNQPQKQKVTVVKKQLVQQKRANSLA